MDALLGGFQVGSVLNFRTGIPVDVLITRPDLAYVGNVGSALAGQVFSSPVVTAGGVQTTAVVNVPGGGNTRNIRRPNVVPGSQPLSGQPRRLYQFGGVLRAGSGYVRQRSA